MNNLVKKVLSLMLSCTIVATMFVCGASADSQSILGVKSIAAHTYGGSNGEWETDADNSTGIWSYYYTPDGTLASKHSLTLSSDNTGYGDSNLMYFAIKNNGFLSPASNGMALIGYKVSNKGAVDIDMTATMDPNNHGVGGDGVTFKFYKNNVSTSLGVLDMPSEQYESNGTTVKPYHLKLANVSVQPGDIIYILQNSKTNIACDGTPVTLAITETAFDDSVTYENHAFVDEFSGTQGENNWYYMYGKDIATIQEMSHYDGNNYKWDTDNAVPYLIIRGDGMLHPGADANGVFNMPAIKWVSPVSGRITADIKVKFEDITNGGNGIIIKIYQNANIVYQYTMTKDQFTDASQVKEISLPNLQMNKNDAIYIALDANGDIACDATIFDINVGYPKVTPGTSNSESTSQSGTDSDTTINDTDSKDSTNNPNTSDRGVAGAGILFTLSALSILMFTLKKRTHA